MACPTINTPYGAALVVTSTTRPTGGDLFFGRIIAEADTSRILWYDSTGWIILYEPVNTSTTASFTGITTGTPTYANSYRRAGGMCWFQDVVTFGSAPGAIASLAVTLPVATAGIAVGGLNVGFRDAFTAVYPGISEVTAAAATSTGIYCILASGTYATFQAPSATIPFAFGAADTMSVSGWFQMNTAYL